MKITSLALFFLFLSNVTFAAGTFPLKEVKFELKAESVQLKTEEALANPEPILINYQPVDAEISNKVVRGNVIEFDATKNILGIKKKAHVYGILTINRNDQLCPNRTMGFALLMDLSNSSELVSGNIEKLTATLCFDKKSDSFLLGQAKGLMYKGDDYNSIEGGIIRTFIDNQVEPIIKALKIVVEK
jgi:hypothetical protein